MKFLVTYDVSDDSRRNKLVKLLERYGKRVQFSCFEIEVFPTNLELLIYEVERIIDTSTDKVFFFPISAYAEKLIVKIGVSDKEDRVF